MDDPRLYEPEPWRRSTSSPGHWSDGLFFGVFLVLWFGFCLWGAITQPQRQPEPAVIIRVEGGGR